MSTPIIWLASYPRSGNTFLRTILFNCFGLPSASVYPNDLGGMSGVEGVAGHIEHSAPGRIDFPKDAPVFLTKTHELPTDDHPAIYVVRDGSEATRSLFEFWRGATPFDKIIQGRRFGTWADHLAQWRPTTRPNTLLLRYDAMCADLDSCIDAIAGFLSLQPKLRNMPAREQLATSGADWIRRTDRQKTPMSPTESALFWSINGQAMREFGYAGAETNTAESR